MRPAIRRLPRPRARVHVARVPPRLAARERLGWFDVANSAVDDVPMLPERVVKVLSDSLPEDAVVTIEPGVYVAGRGGVRIEDDVHLSADGPVLLTDGCTDLLELV